MTLAPLTGGLCHKKQAEQQELLSNPCRARHTAVTAQTFSMGGGETVADLTPTPPTFERKIGNTTYIVTARYTPAATENAAQKMRRFILKESEKVLKIGK